MITVSATPTPRDRKRSRSRRSGFDATWRLCQQIVEFMEDNRLRECKAYIALGNGAPELYVVSQSEAYDFELSGKLSDFAAPYIERGLLGSAALVPASSPEELAAYFDLNKVIRVERVD